MRKLSGLASAFLILTVNAPFAQVVIPEFDPARPYTILMSLGENRVLVKNSIFNFVCKVVSEPGMASLAECVPLFTAFEADGIRQAKAEAKAKADAEARMDALEVQLSEMPEAEAAAHLSGIVRELGCVISFATREEEEAMEARIIEAMATRLSLTESDRSELEKVLSDMIGKAFNEMVTSEVFAVNETDKTATLKDCE